MFFLSLGSGFDVPGLRCSSPEYERKVSWFNRRLNGWMISRFEAISLQI